VKPRLRLVIARDVIEQRRSSQAASALIVLLCATAVLAIVLAMEVLR